MNILVTLDANYIHPLKVMLKSLFLHNEKAHFDIYLIHSGIVKEKLEDLSGYIAKDGHELHDIKIPEDAFAGAPVLLHYTKEMYYRLLAFKYLPENLDRILYLDPDILVINPVESLYNMDLKDKLFGAAYRRITTIKEINKLRLMDYEIEEYYNSGVLMMNLEKQRELIKEEEIFDFVVKNRSRLILPDQDILNSLYARSIGKLNEIHYNFDTRYYKYYRLLSKSRINMDYIMANTVILHFCGKKKPWHANYSGEFHALYKLYERLAAAEKSNRRKAGSF